MKFEYINLLNENNSIGWNNNNMFLPNSITYKGYLLRFIRDKDKLGKLSGTHFVRDCRSRIVNYTKPRQFHEVQYNDDGKIMAVKPSYVLGYDFTRVVDEILRNFCTFNSKNKNNKHQFILKNITVNDNRTISVSEREIDEETQVKELNKSDLFFVFDAKSQYRYGENGLNVYAKSNVRETNVVLGGRHTSNLLLTNDSKFKKYKICSLSSLLDHINSKINKEVSYKKGVKTISAKKILSVIADENRTKSFNLIKQFIQTFDDLNNYGTFSILSNYEKISWDEFDFLNYEIDERLIRSLENANSLADINEEDFNTYEMYDEDEDEEYSSVDFKKDIASEFLGNRFCYIGKYPSNIDGYIEEGSELSYEAVNKESLKSNINSMFSYFDFYGDLTPNTIGDEQKSFLEEIIHYFSGNIKSIYDKNDLSKTYNEIEKDGQILYTNDKDEELNGEQFEKLEEKNEKDNDIPEVEKQLKSLETYLVAITESFSLIKSLVLTSFMGSINMVKGFIQPNNDDINNDITDRVVKARNQIKKGIQQQKSALSSIKKFIFEYIKNEKNDIAVSIKNYNFENFKKSIDNFNKNAFEYQKRVWFQDVKILNSNSIEVTPHVGTSYNEPIQNYANYVSVHDAINDISEKVVTEENNENVEEASNATEKYLNETDNNKSNKNDNDGNEEGGAPVPVNDSYIIRRGDRVYDSSYLHQIVKGRFNVSRNTTLNESNRKTKVLKHQWDQAYNFLNEAVNNLPIRRKFRY